MSSAHLTENWKFLFETITKITAGLRAIDASTELTPRQRLSPIRTNVASVMQRVKAGNLSRIGKINIARDVAFVLNSLNSTDSALERRDMSRKRMADILAGAASKMETLRNEIGIHLDHRTLRHQADEYRRKTEAATTGRSQSELEGKAARAQTFGDFSDAMKALIAHGEEVSAKAPEKVGPRGGTPVEAAAMTEVRERHLFEAIGGEYENELREIRAKLSQFHPGPNNIFTFVRMPVVVISSRQIPTRGLDAAGIRYRVVPFPGIQHGASPGGRHEQSDTYGVILSNQLIAAVPNKIAEGAPAPTSKNAPVVPAAPMGAMRTRGGGKVQANQVVAGMVDLELTRQQIPAILKLRTGRGYVDVLGSNGSKTKFLVSRQLPGFRFIWLLQQDQFSKMGSLNMREVGLPFRGGRA